MEKIKWGIIGCGDVTEIKSGPAFNKVSNSTLVAVMRRDAVKAADYAKRHNVPRWYSDAAELLNDKEVNAIYIATPPDLHELYALATIAAGKNLYIEKPIAINYTSAKNIVNAAASKNIKISIAHYRREQPFFKKIKALIDEKTIGKIVLVKLDLYKPPLTKKELTLDHYAWRVDPKRSGGGLFHDLAPHQIDLLYHWFGEPQTVKGISINQSGNYVADDLVTGSILFNNSVVFSGTWCFNATSNTDHCEIVGTEGAIHFSFFGGNNISVVTKGIKNIYSFENLQHVQQPLIAQIVNYFLGTAPNPCSGAEGAAVMHIIDQFVKGD